MKYSFTIILFCFNILYSIAQQVPLYDQYIANRAIVNPALTAIDDYADIRLIARRQWYGFKGAPITQLITGGLKYDEKNRLGGLVYNDVAGNFKRIGGQLSYAYNIRLSKEYQLAMGISAGIINYRFDINRVNCYEEADNTISNLSVSKTIPNADAGILLYNKSFYVGISSVEIFQSKIYKTVNNSYSHLYTHFYSFVGYNIKASDDVSFEPSLFFKSYKNTSTQFDVNLRVTYLNKISYGFTYRTSGDVIQYIELKIKNNIRFGYYYDGPVRASGFIRNESHEVMLGYYLDKKRVKGNN